MGTQDKTIIYDILKALNVFSLTMGTMLLNSRFKVYFLIQFLSFLRNGGGTCVVGVTMRWKSAGMLQVNEWESTGTNGLQDLQLGCKQGRQTVASMVDYELWNVLKCVWTLVDV